MFSNLIHNQIWLQALQPALELESTQNLAKFLTAEIAQGKQILPAQERWFHALNLADFAEVKVVILGQDPYPTPGHAMGLAFSVEENVLPLPKSLLNIYKELLDDLGVDNFHSGNLESWAKQGVLLLNAVLTVEAGLANSHQNQGWEQLTDKIIATLSRLQPGLVFVLWGKNAQQKRVLIDEAKHLVIADPHPSPLSAYRGFFGSKPFSKINNQLISQGKSPINWQLPAALFSLETGEK